MHSTDAKMDNATLVPKPHEVSEGHIPNNTCNTKSHTTPEPNISTPITQKDASTSSINRMTTEDIINASLRKSTSKKYLVYQNKWNKYCSQYNIRCEHPTVNEFLSFFTALFNEEASYSVLMSAKSAVLHMLDIKCQHISQHRSVKKFFKGVFNLRPPLPKISFVWDVQIIFDHFISLGDNKKLSDKHMSQKLLILLLLLGGQRINSIFHFTIDRMVISTNSVTFSPGHVLKHSRQGKKLDTFEYRAFTDPKLCVLECLKEYIERREQKVPESEKKLFITNKKPYHATSENTLRRWVKQVFQDVHLIDFTPHSCRSASTSKASNMNFDIIDILKKGCWSNAKTFYKYYKKEITEYKEVDFNRIIEQ